MKLGKIRLKLRYLFLLIIVIYGYIFPVFSQIPGSNINQPPIPDKFNYREKIFLHIDRKLYLSGEIIWFKGYCTDGVFNIPADVSKVLYVEILNNQNQPILSEKVPLEKGTSKGSVYIPRSIQTGIYLIRAYTKWMTNFPAGYYFTDKIYIVNPFLPLETYNFMPDESEEYTVQFFTYNGILEKDRNNDVAYHAINQMSRGVNLRGWVVDESGDTLSELNTWGHGYGLFSFTPSRIEGHYKIITISSKGKRKEILLPFPVINKPFNLKSTENNTSVQNKGFDILLNTGKSIFSPREKVTLTINTKNSNGNAVSSNLSISVYKSDNQIELNHKNIYQYLNYSSIRTDNMSLPDDQFPFTEYNSDTLKNILNIIFSSSDSTYANIDINSDQTYTLPETRGLTLNGVVYSTQNGKPSSGIKLYIAQPGKKAQIYATRSVYNGRFQIQLFNQYGQNDIIVMPAENPDNYYIVLDGDFINRYSNMNPELFWSDEPTVKYIERLMVNMQIADAFGINRTQQNDMKKYDLPSIYGEPDESILLADYIKLPAVEELFTELVKSVIIKRKRNNNFELQIIDPSTRLPISGKPLLLLDGVPVLDINPVIIYMDPIDIEKIDVVRYPYIQGNESYQGIINIITKQADFHHFDLPSYGTRQPYHFFQTPLTFYSPDHSSDSDSLRSIPDFRNLLYWNPEVITNDNGTVTVSFYTSDDISDYRIIIQGLNEYGLPGFTEGTISVK
jgi:hypothetical protein